MLITESKKNQAIIDVLSDQRLEIDDLDGIAYLDPGLNTHKSAKRQATDEGTYDSLFEVFERTWGTTHAYASMTDPKTEVIVEMGCANMLAYNAFKTLRLFPNYIGIDIRKDYLLRAEVKNRKDVLGMCADLTKPLPIKSNSVSAVILSEVVEHLTYEQNMIFLKEAHRILKPGGKMLISSPVNTESREFHKVEDETHLGHVFFWTAEKLEEEMLNVGFKDVDKKWGLSISSKIRIDEIKKSLHPEVVKFIDDIRYMYGAPIARAIALSAPNVVNGGCRFTFTK